MEPLNLPITATKLLACLKRLPSLPAVATDLLRSFDDPNADVESLVRKMALDPALSADALRLANSSFYGLRGKVSNLHDAILVLGLRQLRTVVVTAAVIKTLHPGSACCNLSSFWRHSLGVALSARQLALETGEPAELAYLAGLLHDIGRLALACCFPDAVCEADSYRSRHDCHRFEAERDVLGLDHADAGRTITERWHFPPAIQEAVAAHHAPEHVHGDSLAGLVHVADVMAHALDLSADPNDRVPPLSAMAWKRLGLDWPDFAIVLARVEQSHRELVPLLLAA